MRAVLAPHISCSSIAYTSSYLPSSHTMSVSAPWNIYNKELFHHGFGTALWEPEPTQHGEVLLGDVGYLREGVFFRLFNATRNEDDEIHTTYGVPDKFEPLQLNTFGIHTRPNALPAGALCSKSVLSRSAGAGTSLYVTLSVDLAPMTNHVD